jgi:sugar phosphate isomerase/epimerase
VTHGSVTVAPLSVQLYTVREMLRADLAGTLHRLAALGFTQVEPFAFTTFGEALGHAMAEAGLTAPTTHQHFIGEDPEPVFAAAAAMGIGTVIDPRVDRGRWGSVADVEQIAADLNAAAAVAADHGVRVGYHNHAQELEIVLAGRTALEVFAEQLDDSVMLEVDTYWAAVAGQDPVALLRRLGDRVGAVHLKDGPASADVKDQVAVGHGGMPIRDILDATPHALRVIELDDSRGDRFQAVADSYAWLAANGPV